MHRPLPLEFDRFLSVPRAYLQETVNMSVKADPAPANDPRGPFATAGQPRCFNRSFLSRKSSMALMQAAGYSSGRKWLESGMKS